MVFSYVFLGRPWLSVPSSWPSGWPTPVPRCAQRRTSRRKLSVWLLLSSADASLVSLSVNSILKMCEMLQRRWRWCARPTSSTSCVFSTRTLRERPMSCSPSPPSRWARYRKCHWCCDLGRVSEPETPGAGVFGWKRSRHLAQLQLHLDY